MSKDCAPASYILLCHRAMAGRTASLMVFFENVISREWHKPHAPLMSGYSPNGITAPCSCPSVHLLTSLEGKCRGRINNSLRVSPPGYRYGTWPSSFRSTLPLFLVGLLYGVPTVFDAQFPHGITGQFLNVRSVDDTTNLGALLSRYGDVPVNSL